MAEVGALLVEDALPLQLVAIDGTTVVTVSNEGPGSETRPQVALSKKRLAIAAAATVVLALVGIAARSVHGTGEPTATVPALDDKLMQAFAPLGSKFCGITHNPHMCPEMLGLLRQADPSGVGNILCKCEMAENKCQLDTMMDMWKSVDPSMCREDPGVLLLWEVPDKINADPSGFDFDPVCGYPNVSNCVDWAAKSWMEYVDLWRPKLPNARVNGLKVAAPIFTGDMFGKLAGFFAACPLCNQEGSPYYIDGFAFNHGVNPNTAAAELAAVRDKVQRLKAAYGQNRPVIIPNLGIWAANAQGVASVIKSSGLFDHSKNPVDAMYWSVYPSSTFSPPLARSVLPDVVQAGPDEGKNLAQVFMEECGKQR